MVVESSYGTILGIVLPIPVAILIIPHQYRADAMVTEGMVIVGTNAEVEVLILPVEFTVTRHLTILASYIVSHTIFVFLSMILPVSSNVIIGDTSPYTQAICNGRKILAQRHIGKERTGMSLAVSTTFCQCHRIVISSPCCITTPETIFGLDRESSSRNSINLTPKIITAQTWARCLHQDSVQVGLQLGS